MPPRSPDATPCDFFLWGYIEDQVYVPPLPASIPSLKVRIRTAIETITADMLQTVWNELDYRVDYFHFLSPCNIVNFKTTVNQLVAHNVFHLVKSHFKTH